MTNDRIADILNQLRSSDGMSYLHPQDLDDLRAEFDHLRAVQKAAIRLLEVDYDDGNEAAWAVAAADLSTALEAKP